METRVGYTTKTRVLADGTVKKYRSAYHYKVKNGVDDHRKDGNSGPKDKLTPDQKAEVILKYKMGVKINRICEDLGVSYGPVNRCLKETKEAVNEDKNNE